MATRGAKPKSAHLRLVQGTHNTTRHGDRAKAREKADQVLAKFGKLERPKNLKGHALQAWKQFIEPATWLDGSRMPLAIAFCELWQEFRDAPRGFPASRHGQMRAYLSELGLSDERRRLDDDPKDRDEFFDD